MHDIEVILIKGDYIKKKIMTLDEAKKLPKIKGVKYIYYQIGYSQFKLTL